MVIPLDATPDPDPAVLARDLAFELVRAFAAISSRLAAAPAPPGTPPEAVAADLQAWVGERLADVAIVFRDGLDETILELAEAVDQLAPGQALDASRVEAFGGG